ncbi:MAG: hypothetical protein QXY49_02610 [Thermofilaceae archaeon]
MKQWHEVVVLLLEDVVVRSMDYTSLEDFLERRLGFGKVEEDESILETHRHKPVSILTREERTAVYTGYFMSVKITIEFLGTIEKELETMKVNDEEQKIYSAKYEMIKVISESGYTLQRLIEELEVNLGLHIGKREWVFHRIDALDLA